MSQILVVEDDEPIRRGLCIRLQAAGYAVLEASDADAALRVAVDERPDLVILDLSIPGGGGFSVAERLGADASTSGTPVIFLTASAQPEHAGRALELGAAAFFPKPYVAAALLESIRTILGRVRSAG